jgi:membrane-bound lytic murein transglycosylase D
MKTTFLLITSICVLIMGSACQRVDQAKQAWSKINKRPQDNRVHFNEDLTPYDWSKVNTDFWYSKNARIDAFRKKYEQTRDPWALFEKAQPYLPFIRKTFVQYGLPNELCLLPMIESSFSPRARSARAAGLWQFVPGTAQDMGLEVNHRIDERLEWERSTEAAAKYLSHLAQRYQGDWARVLAAYNMGPGAIDRAVKAQGTEQYWDLQLREETEQYVPKFLAMLTILRETYPKY